MHTTSAPYSSRSQGRMTEVSSPPEYPSTTFIEDSPGAPERGARAKKERPGSQETGHFPPKRRRSSCPLLPPPDPWSGSVASRRQSRCAMHMDKYSRTAHDCQLPEEPR